MSNAPVDEIDHKAHVRQSAVGKKLTQSQFEDAWSIGGILERQIKKHGIFREKLSDYAYAFSRTERFDMVKAEEIIRDVFTERYGQTMNQLREALVGRESELDQTIGNAPLRHAQSVLERIAQGPSIPFYLAHDEAAIAMAAEHGITEARGKDMMRTAFAAHEGRELYDVGKETEARFHNPVRDEDSRAERKSYSGKRQHSRR